MNKQGKNPAIQRMPLLCLVLTVCLLICSCTGGTGYGDGSGTGTAASGYEDRGAGWESDGVEGDGDAEGSGSGYVMEDSGIADDAGESAGGSACGGAEASDNGDDFYDGGGTGSPARTDAGAARPEVVKETELEYASQFRIEGLADGCTLITAAGEETLLVPEGAEVPGYAEGMRVVMQPAGNIYLAATSAADFFVRLDALDHLGYISTTVENQSDSSIKEAMESGRILYAGKYSAPDYELLYSGGCSLALESTMILHTPEVKEQLENLGIPVFTERSSYETHPLGRAEWVKLYGLLTGKQEEAEEIFETICESYNNVIKRVDELEQEGAERPRVAYFYITSAGVVNIHKPGGYMSALIEAAGGEYFADPLDLDQDVYANALSTMNIQMEDFYALARDADILIYNGNYGAGIKDLEDLKAMNPLLSEFRAVQNADVWFSGKNMFQQPGAAGEVVKELFRIFTGEPDTAGFTYFRKLI